jgi:hypothetical protein
VLDVVETEFLALDANELLSPRPDGEETGRYGNFPDAADGIMLQHDIDSEGVVQVDPVGTLLVPGKVADANRRERGQIVNQPFPIGLADLRVGDAIDAIGV